MAAFIRPAALAFALASTAGCGSPSAPSSHAPSSLLPDGRYLFTVNAVAGLAGCSPRWDAAVVTHRFHSIEIRRENSDWVGRRTTPFGDFELRLSATGIDGVVGTVRGLLVADTGSDPDGPGDVVTRGASFGSTAGGGGGRFVTGVVPLGTSGYGRIEGAVTFLDGGQAPMTCPEAEWSLTRSPLD